MIRAAAALAPISGSPIRPITRRAIAGAGSMNRTGHADSRSSRSRRSGKCVHASTTVSVRRPASSMKQGASSAATSASATGSPRSAASASEASRPEPTSVTSAPLAKSSDQFPGVFAADGCLGAEHRDPPRHRAGTGRLDRRHGPDERDRILLAQVRQNQRRGGVAGDHDQIGVVAGDQFAHQRDDPLDQRGLSLLAVGEEGVIGNIVIARVRPRIGDLAEDRKAAEPGIEHKDGRRRRHGGCWYEMTGGIATAMMRPVSWMIRSRRTRV